MKLDARHQSIHQCLFIYFSHFFDDLDSLFPSRNFSMISVRIAVRSSSSSCHYSSNDLQVNDYFRTITLIHWSGTDWRGVTQKQRNWFNFRKRNFEMKQNEIKTLRWGHSMRIFKNQSWRKEFDVNHFLFFILFACRCEKDPWQIGVDVFGCSLTIFLFLGVLVQSIGTYFHIGSTDIHNDVPRQSFDQHLLFSPRDRDTSSLVHRTKTHLIERENNQLVCVCLVVIVVI